MGLINLIKREWARILFFRRRPYLNAYDGLRGVYRPWSEEEWEEAERLGLIEPRKENNDDSRRPNPRTTGDESGG